MGSALQPQNEIRHYSVVSRALRSELTCTVPARELRWTPKILTTGGGAASAPTQTEMSSYLTPLTPRFATPLAPLV